MTEKLLEKKEQLRITLMLGRPVMTAVQNSRAIIFVRCHLLVIFVGFQY